METTEVQAEEPRVEPQAKTAKTGDKGRGAKKGVTTSALTVTTPPPPGPSSGSLQTSGVTTPVSVPPGLDSAPLPTTDAAASGTEAVSTGQPVNGEVSQASEAQVPPVTASGQEPGGSSPDGANGPGGPALVRAETPEKLLNTEAAVPGADVAPMGHQTSGIDSRAQKRESARDGPVGSVKDDPQRRLDFELDESGEGEHAPGAHGKTAEQLDERKPVLEEKCTDFDDFENDLWRNST